MDTESKQAEVFISIDEWQNIVDWMFYSLGSSEKDSAGHFLLEVVGTRRTWVTTDGSQLTVLQTEGPVPRGSLYSSEGLNILVNSRLFRGKTPEDVTLVVTETDGRRSQRMLGEGFEISLPEHPGPFLDWREAVESIEGARIQVESQRLIEACGYADTAPYGVENEAAISAWLYVYEQRLAIEAPWIEFPHTKVFIEASGDLQDSVPVLISPRRLRNLLLAIDPAIVTLVIPSDPLGILGIEYGSYKALLLPIDRWGAEKRRLEELLCEFLRTKSVEPDDDGDYAITTPDGNTLWVRLQTDIRPIAVQVFSVLASGVPCTNELLIELNSINASAPHVKVIWASDAIMAEVDIVAEALDIAELANALTVVQETADRYRPVLGVFFGDSGE